jgi:hypothetical protein
MNRLCFVLTSLLLLASTSGAAEVAPLGSPIPPVPEKARLVLSEAWADGKIDPARWYTPRNKWGAGNHGVIPENVRVGRDWVFGGEKHVVVCHAHGDQYDGELVGFQGRKDRVGGVLISRDFFASGRFEVVMKVGDDAPHAGGPADPKRPSGMVPAVWTYAYRFINVGRQKMDQFVPEQPLYNPHMKRYGGGMNEYWSELDFPEYGKAGEFDRAMYNTFLQNQHEPKFWDVSVAIDGKYHTYTTDWRTTLTPIDLTDEQVVEAEGYWWVKDKAVPFHTYWGNPLKRLGKDKYMLYTGLRADHWIDGKKVAENTRFVPAMAAQLTMGVWLPDWAGTAKWKTASVSFAAVKVWQYDDQGDVRGVLTASLKDNFDKSGKPVK